MVFNLGRQEGFPSQYNEFRIPVIGDIVDIGIIIFSIILFVSLLLISPLSYKHAGSSYGIRPLFSVFIGSLILYNNYGQEWEINALQSNIMYKAVFIGKQNVTNEIDAHIEIKIGLRSINITLKSHTLKTEIIDYNERFEWTWDQGIIGFGPHSGHLQQSFRKSQFRGLPLPILSIVDYFIIDGENFRFGRFYRAAGWYTHKILFIAFVVWVFAVLKFNALVTYKAILIFLVGILQIFANIIWHFVKNPIPMIILFENGRLTPMYGFNFWSNLISGIVCLILGVIIFFIDNFCPDATAVFFGLDPLSEFEEMQLTKKELNTMTQDKNLPKNEFEMEQGINSNPSGPTDSEEVLLVLSRSKSIIRRRHLRSIVLPDERLSNFNELNSNMLSLQNEFVGSTSTLPMLPKS